VGVAGKVGETTGSGRSDAGVAVDRGSATAIVALTVGSDVNELGSRVGDGNPPEPIAPGGGTSARVQASIPRMSAMGAKRTANLGENLCLTSDLIEFIAARTGFQLLVALREITIIRIGATGCDPTFKIKRYGAIG